MPAIAVSPDLIRQLNDYHLTTAKILYHMPDHPALLQTYIWQDYDLRPRFPVLRKFLDFWTRNLDGKLHSVQVASCAAMHVPRWRNATNYFTLH